MTGASETTGPCGGFGATPVECGVFLTLGMGFVRVRR
jgi:hypothetical protein